MKIICLVIGWGVTGESTGGVDTINFMFVSLGTLQFPVLWLSWGLIPDYWWNRKVAWCCSDTLPSPLNPTIITCYGNPSTVLICVFSDSHCEFMMHSQASGAILQNSISWLPFLNCHPSAQHKLKNNSCFILSPCQCYLMTVSVLRCRLESFCTWLPALPSSSTLGFLLAGIACVGLAMSSADWFIMLIWV